jgi:hypothetical protein
MKAGSNSGRNWGGGVANDVRWVVYIEVSHIFANASRATTDENGIQSPG